MARMKSKRYGYKVQINTLSDGDISYTAVFKQGGKMHWKKIGNKSNGINEKKCMEQRSRIISENKHGVDLSLKSSKEITFDELAQKYFESVGLVSQHKYIQMYNKHIKPLFGDAKVVQLSDSNIDTLRNTKESEYAQSTIKQLTSLSTRIINFGMKRRIIDFNPFLNTRPFKINNTRLKYLSKDEIALLYDAVEDDIVKKLFVLIALETGARAKSILALQKKDIDIDNKIITLEDFKRHNSYVGYMNDKAFSILTNHIKDFNLDGYIVSSNGKKTQYVTMYKKIKPILDKLFNDGLDKKDSKNRTVLHTLRHTFASQLAINGVPIQEIKKLMNHSDIKMTMKYAKLMPNSGRKFVNELYV